MSSEETWKLNEQRKLPQQRIERRSWDTVSPETPFPPSKKQTFQPQKLNQESKYRNFLWGARGLCSILGSPTPGSFKGEMRTLNSHLWKPRGDCVQEKHETLGTRELRLKRLTHRHTCPGTQHKTISLKSTYTIGEETNLLFLKYLPVRQETVGTLFRDRDTGRYNFYNQSMQVRPVLLLW